MSSQPVWLFAVAAVLPLVTGVLALVQAIVDRTRIKTTLDIAAAIRARHPKVSERLEAEVIKELAATDTTREWFSFALIVLVTIVVCMQLWTSGARSLAGLAFLVAIATARWALNAIAIRRLRNQVALEASSAEQPRPPDERSGVRHSS